MHARAIKEDKELGHGTEGRQAPCNPSGLQRSVRNANAHNYRQAVGLPPSLDAYLRQAVGWRGCGFERHIPTECKKKPINWRGFHILSMFA
ncbi:MAG: hypothetical protein LBS52_03410 [Dysgonamonadaceae bacterium]|nr:hypothetical protein [Dysgonamonadaceae bacterium]